MGFNRKNEYFAALHNDLKASNYQSSNTVGRTKNLERRVGPPHFPLLKPLMDKVTFEDF